MIAAGFLSLTPLEIRKKRKEKKNLGPPLPWNVLDFMMGTFVDFVGVRVYDPTQHVTAQLPAANLCC